MVRCRVLPFSRKASTTRTYSCVTPAPPAARTTRRNMAPPISVPADSNTNQGDASGKSACFKLFLSLRFRENPDDPGSSKINGIGSARRT